MAMSANTHVIFVHGLFSNADTWKKFTALLAKDRELRRRVTVRCFGYDSPKIRLRPDRRIADVDDIADRLGSYVRHQCADGAPIVLVSHSQGGLVVQRFLARRLWHHRGGELAHIKHIVMYSCPNNGSGFFLFLRKALLFWRNVQERELRPLSTRAVLEAQRTVLQRVVNAKTASDSECPIPISAFGGQTDNVVPAVNATNPWGGETIEGDHRSIVKPADRAAESYVVLKKILREVVAAQEAPQPPDAPAALPAPAPQPAELPGEEEGPFSVALPHKDGRLHGRARQQIVSDIVTSGSGVHVLTGPGGSGKSRLALEIAAQAVARGRLVWWVRVNQLSACMREVARELGIPDSQADEAWRGDRSQTDLVWRFLNAAEKPWLIVFDNADEPEARLAPRGGSVKDGTGWLRPPEGGNGMIVVTSQVNNRDIWGDWSQVRRVPRLDDTDGASMLIERTGPGAGTTEQARLLSHELGGLPLALRTAAKYIRSVRESGVSLGANDIRDFETYRKAWARRSTSPPGSRKNGDDESLGLEKIVDEVYGISLGLLERRGLPQAAPLLKALACLNIAPIPYRRLLRGEAPTRSALWTEFTTNQRIEAIMGLRDLDLIEVDHTRADFLTLHPFVHTILRADQDVQRRSTDYYALNVHMLLDAIRDHDPDYPDAWTVWPTVAPHTIEVTRSILRADGPTDDRSVLTSALELARLTVRYLLVAGHLAPARTLLLPMIEQCEAFGFHRDDREILGLRHEKARIDLETGELEASEAELKAVIARRTEILTDRHHDTLASRHKLARAILEQDRAPEAEKILRSVVEHEKGVRGPEHADTMVVRHTHARALLALDSLAEAETHLREILEIRLRKWAPGTPETLHVRESLGCALLEQLKVDEAFAMIDSGLRDARQSLDSHPVMRLRYVRGKALLMRGQVEEATTALNSLLADQVRVLGEAHREVRLTRYLLNRMDENL
ncbi:alpha/beta fold hydrolase [Streptomyces sp. NPDC048581]|uniref:alpha/beta hydrolase n=1 Tax=Streptomyces sp. NPDC048581 TaxID=3365572 RepID=UPI00370FDDEC